MRRRSKKPRRGRDNWWADYSKYLASPAWAAKRRAVLERAGYRCQACGKSASHVHHTKQAYSFIRRFGFGMEPNAYLQALCADDHAKVHGRPIGEFGKKPGAGKSGSWWSRVFGEDTPRS